MQKIKNQHYVPQYSLRRFSDMSGKVWVFAKNSGKIFNTEVGNVACERYFYDMKKSMHDPAEPEKFQITERTLKLIEDNGQKSIDNVLGATEHFRSLRRKYHKWDNKVIYRGDRESLAIFAAVQYLRTPDQREAIEEITYAIAKVYLNSIVQEFGLTGEDYDLELTEDHVTGWHGISTLKHGLEIAEVMKRYIWMFGANATGIPLVISDTPVVKIIPKGTDLHSYAGFLTPGIQIAFPLSPDLLLFLCDRTVFSKLTERDGKCFQLSKEEVENLNELQLISCRVQLYGPSEDYSFAQELIRGRPELASPREHTLEVSGPLTEGIARSAEKNRAPYIIQW